MTTKGSFINKEGKMYLSFKRCCYDIRGLTMIELMVAMALGMIITSVVFVFYGGFNSNGAFQLEVSKLQSDLNAAADMMEIDIMNAGSNPPPSCETPGCTLPAANTTFTTNAINYTYSGNSSIRIYADMDGNNVLSGDNEVVLYRWNRSKKCIERLNWDYNASLLPRPAYSILDNVKDFNITYYEPYHATFCPNDESAYNCNGILYECNMNEKLTDTAYFTPGAVVNNPISYTNRTSQYTLVNSTVARRVDLVILDITVETNRLDPETGRKKEISIQKWIELRNRR